MNGKRRLSRRMPNPIDGSFGKYFFAFIILCIIKICNAKHASTNLSPENILWDIVKRELTTNGWVNLSNIPNDIAGNGTKISIGMVNICSVARVEIKKQISLKCINSLKSLLDYTSADKIGYSIRVRKGVSLNEALARLCLDATNKFLNNLDQLCQAKRTQRATHRNKALAKDREMGGNKIDNVVPSRDTEESNARKDLEMNNLLKLIQSVLFDFKDSLVPSRELISQIRKPKQGIVSKMIIRKDLNNLAVLLSNEKKEDALSFLSVLINRERPQNIEDLTFENIRSKLKSRYELANSIDKSRPFGFMPTSEDEWNAIVTWIQSTDRVMDSGNWMIKKIYGRKELKFPEKYVASKAVESTFIDNCFRGIRDLAYKVFIAPNGDRYYKYNKYNDYGIIIEGKNQNDRIRNIRSACRAVFERYYSYLGIKTKTEKEELNFKISGKLNFLLPLKHDRLFLNKLIKSFYKSINDRDREWHAVVNEARVSPLVNSQDLSEDVIPYDFTDENINREPNLEKKEALLSDICFKAINTLKRERNQGISDTPLYKIEVGSENEVSIAKFCKGLFERFILRHIEWLRIIIKSIDSEHIKLIDMSDPYLEIPEVFLFPEDARLRENCITSLIVVFEKNTQAIENGYPVKVYPQMDYIGEPDEMIDNITLFCESLSGKVTQKTVRRKDKSVTQDLARPVNPEFKLMELVKKNIDSNLLLNFGTKMEGRIDQITQNNLSSGIFRLENWRSHFEEVSSLDSHVESMVNILKAQFSEFIDYEGGCEKKIRRYLNHITSKTDEANNTSWLENYIMETDKLKGDWATELQSIENLQKSMLAAEGELERYVNAIRSAVYGDERQKEMPQIRKILNEWPKELSNKERVYIKHKIDSLLSKQKHESNIEGLRYEQLERRMAFRESLKKSLLDQNNDKPILFDLEKCFKDEDEDLVPIYPDKETKEEEKIRLARVSSIETAQNEYKDRFSLINSSLNEQLGSLESFLSTAQKNFQTAWTESFNTALALQLEIRTRALVEEYVRASERYLLIKRVKADYEYRKSIVSEFQADSSFEAMLNRASEMIEKADKEELELERELAELHEQKNKLHLLVEEDMQNIYSQRLRAIRDSKELIKAKIDNEKKLLMLEQKVFEDQLQRDLEYYNIKEVSEAAIYRAEQLKILYEATNWLLNFNEKMTISSESQFREDLEKLDYVIPIKGSANSKYSKDDRFNLDILKANLRRHKYTHNEGFDINDIEDQQELKKEAGAFYNDDQSQGQIPNAAQSLLRMFKEKLVIRINDIDEINQQILQLNLNMVGSFQYFDYNRERAYKSFRELPYSKAASNTFAVILSHFEWEHIQLRWRILQLTKYILNDKESKLNEISELRSSLDNQMREFNAVPLSRKLVPVGTLSSLDTSLNEITGSKKSEEDSLELLPSNIPNYLLSDKDYTQVRSYDLGVKKIILNKILFTLSANESRYAELLKETIYNINKQKKTAELEIQNIKSELDELRKTIGYKMLSKEDRDVEEEKFKKEISKITESKNLVPLLAKKEILIRKSEKIDLFRNKVQNLFQDPSFTAELARMLENAVYEFFGAKSSIFDEITPRIKLAEEINKLQSMEEEIAELEKTTHLNTKSQENYSKLHRLKIKCGEVKENISKLNEQIDSVNQAIKAFQDKHFTMVFETN